LELRQGGCSESTLGRPLVYLCHLRSKGSKMLSNALRCGAEYKVMTSSAISRLRLLASLFVAAFLLVVGSLGHYRIAAAAERPNILWITCEDISPYLGCWGDPNALTPNLDRLASQGIRYTQAYANAPVCAVARCTIAFGMYSTTLGTHQMRTRERVPERFRLLPEYLRQAGYFCTNCSKTDYNIVRSYTAPWDECSGKAHWRHRKPGQPFFSVFNFTITHESQLSPRAIERHVKAGRIPPEPRVDPARVTLPPYHPDVPEIRYDWARLYDLITAMDKQVGEILQQLEEDGLADDTIVFFYSDHGGTLSAAKRYNYNRGTRVPMIVRFPAKWQHLAPAPPGSTVDRLVSFVDLAPTVLSLVGLPVPQHMQGHAFLGPKATKPPKYVYFFRDRMAERYDFVRAITDGRYRYIRNFLPERPRGRDTRYGFTVQRNWNAWLREYEAGRCNKIQSAFWEPKPVEELYDLEADPWEVHNLAGDPKYAEVVERLRGALYRWMTETGDLGLVPEPMFDELIGEGKPYATLYDYGQSDDYPVEQLLRLADCASRCGPEAVPKYVEALSHPHPAARYWGLVGLMLHHKQAAGTKRQVEKLLADPSVSVRIAAAELLARLGDPDEAFSVLKAELDRPHKYAVLAALNALENARLADRVTGEQWQSLAKKLRGDRSGGYGFDYSMRIVGKYLPDSK